MKILKKIINAFNRLSWIIQIKKMKCVGKNCKCQKGFSIIGEQFISIGDEFKGGENVSIHAWDKYNNKTNPNKPKIIIGNNVSMTKNCYISCVDKIVIGDGVLMGVNSFITDNLHGNNGFEELEIAPSERELYSKGPVSIGNNVWLGRNVCVMPNVTIGNGTIVGANAVVTHDLPEACIAAGVPAKVIKYIKQSYY